MLKIVNINKLHKYLVGVIFFAISDISRMFQLIGVPREIPYAIYLLLFAIYIIKNFRRIKIIDILFYLIVGFVSFYGLSNFSAYIASRTSMLSVIIVFLPAFIFFRLYSEDEIMKCVIPATYFSAIYLLLYYVFFIRGNSSSYSMSYAYWISFPVSVFYGLFLERKKPIFLFTCLIMLATIILSGCRGALGLTVACLGYLYVTVSVLNAKKDIKWYLRLVIIGIIFLVVFLNIDVIINYISKYTDISRNIQKLLNGDFFESESRDNIYKVCKMYISLKPWGYGPLASRKLVYGHNYPHSLFYELQLDYGKYIGVILFLVIVFMAVSNLYNYRKTSFRVVVGYIGIIGIGSLMVSSSYFYDIYVPATIAIYINYIYRKRAKNKVDRLCVERKQ